MWIAGVQHAYEVRGFTLKTWTSSLGYLGITRLKLVRTAWGSFASVSCGSFPLANSSKLEYLLLSVKTFLGFLSSRKSHWGNGWASFHSSSCLDLEQSTLNILSPHIPLIFFFLENPKDIAFSGTRSHLEILKLLMKQKCLGSPGTEKCTQAYYEGKLKSSCIKVITFKILGNKINLRMPKY